MLTKYKPRLVLIRRGSVNLIMLQSDVLARRIGGARMAADVLYRGAGGTE